MIYSDRGFFTSYFEQAFVQGSSSVTCTEGIVECVAGMVKDSNPIKSCFDECAHKCCSTTDESGGANTCSGFTGSVCRDGSCIGTLACHNAGNDGGFIGLIESASCVGLEGKMGPFKL